MKIRYKFKEAIVIDENTPLKVGDKVICVSHGNSRYKFGEVYTLNLTKASGTLAVDDKKGNSDVWAHINPVWTGKYFKKIL